MGKLQIDYETACIWVKEARFQDGHSGRFLDFCLEFEGLGARKAVQVHIHKMKRLLQKDRKESELERYSDELLFHSKKT